MNLTKRQKKLARWAIAFSIMIAYLVFIAPFIFAINSASNKLTRDIEELTKPPEPYTFQIPLYFSFNGTTPFVNVSETDFRFLLTITYPNGTLIVNDVVNITAAAVMDNVVRTLDHVGIIFPNSLVSPISYEDNNFPRQGILIFNNPIGGEGVDNPTNTFRNITVETNINVEWVSEGEYTPIIGFFFNDGTSKVYSTTNFVIHVYPKEQLTQQESNRVSLENNSVSLQLSLAVFALSTATIVALFVQIVDHSETECNYNQNQTTDQHKCPYLEDKRRNRFREVIRNKGKTDENTNNADET